MEVKGLLLPLLLKDLNCKSRGRELPHERNGVLVASPRGVWLFRTNAIFLAVNVSSKVTHEEVTKHCHTVLAM